MKPTECLQNEVQLLSRKLGASYLIFGMILLLQAGLFFGVNTQADGEIVDNSGKIIKTKGIIVVDEQGRERVLIGAPIPQSKDRVLTDKTKALTAWKNKFPEDHPYWKYFNDLKTSAYGMVVLDENGFDRLAVGDQLPDANTGRRIGTATGITIHNKTGFERAGFGLIETPDGSRVGLGMDDEHGEALNLFAAKGIGYGIRINDSKNQIILGTFEPNKMFNTSNQPFSGYMFRQGNDVKHQFNALQSK